MPSNTARQALMAARCSGLAGLPLPAPAPPTPGAKSLHGPVSGIRPAATHLPAARRRTRRAPCRSPGTAACCAMDRAIKGTGIREQGLGTLAPPLPLRSPAPRLRLDAGAGVALGTGVRFDAGAFVGVRHQGTPGRKQRIPNADAGPICVMINTCQKRLAVWLVRTFAASRFTLRAVRRTCRRRA